MNLLPNEALCYIFSFCGGYKYRCRQVCALWRELNEEDKLLYLEQLCKDSLVTRVSKVELLQEAMEKNYVNILLASTIPVKGLCIYAAKIGSLALLKKARNSNNWGIYLKVVKSKRLQKLAWLLDANYPGKWKKLSGTLDEEISNRALKVCLYSARGGHLEILKWLHKQDFPRNEYTCAYAAKGGHLDVLKWLHEQGYPWDEVSCSYAAKGGHLDVLKWLHEQGCPWDIYTSSWIAKGGHLEVLKWVHEQGCPIDEYTYEKAAKGGHLNVLKWLRKQGCSWDEYTFVKAAENGNLDVLKWLKKKGCPWNLDTCPNAARKGNLKALEWLIENGCPWDKALTQSQTFK